MPQYDALAALGLLTGAPEPNAFAGARGQGLVPTDDPSLWITPCGTFGVVACGGLYCINRRVEGWWEPVRDVSSLDDVTAAISAAASTTPT